jgi:hypothetical protein
MNGVCNGIEKGTGLMTRDEIIARIRANESALRA